MRQRRTEATGWLLGTGNKEAFTPLASVVEEDKETSAGESPNEAPTSERDEAEAIGWLLGGTGNEEAFIFLASVVEADKGKESSAGERLSLTGDISCVPLKSENMKGMLAKAVEWRDAHVVLFC